MKIKFEHQSFTKQVKSMLAVDFRRMFTMPFLYIMIGCCLVMPILILVMTTMMDGSVTVDPQTGAETVIKGFDSTWQAIGSLSNVGMSMDITSMCNINMLYFFIAVFVCIFTGADFRSGYAKNLFTVRAKRTDYVISKTLAGFVGGVCMLLAFFVGTLVGGAVAGLSFEMQGFTIVELVMCMLAKMLVVGVFVPIYFVMSVIAKEKTWLSIMLSMMTGMFLFMMIPMITPLDATIVHVILCFAGGSLFSLGLGAVSASILKKKNIV